MKKSTGTDTGGHVRDDDDLRVKRARSMSHAKVEERKERMETMRHTIREHYASCAHELELTKERLERLTNHANSSVLCSVCQQANLLDTLKVREQAGVEHSSILLIVVVHRRNMATSPPTSSSSTWRRSLPP